MLQERMKENMSERLTYSEFLTSIDLRKIRPDFDEKWFKENYKDITTRLVFICSCGNKMEVQAKTIRKKNSIFDKQCKECISKTKATVQKIPYEDAVQTLKEQQCKPGFTKKWYKENYTGIHTELPIICKCKETFHRNLTAFRKSPYCVECRLKEKTLRLSFETVVKTIKAKGLKPNFNQAWFNANYKNNLTNLPLLCKCKEPMTKSYVELSKVKFPFCKECQGKKEIEEKFKELESYTSSKNAKMKFNLQWFETNFVDNTTVLPFSCECGKDTNVQYRRVKLSPLICNSCRKKGTKNKILENVEVEDDFSLCYPLTPEWRMKN
jgi:hypothetical protein